MDDCELAPNRAKPCPFCAHMIDTTDPDFCHPTTRPDPKTGKQVWSANCPEAQGGCGAEVLGNSQEEAIQAWNHRAWPPSNEGQVYGIIDPDYGRAYTIIRKLAWEEGYAIGLHGSFTRDLDLIAVPWTDNPCEPEHLVSRILYATKMQSLPTNPGIKPQGRLVWTLLFPDFGDPRFIDLGIMPSKFYGKCSECGKTSTKDQMHAVYCVECIESKIGPALAKSNIEIGT